MENPSGGSEAQKVGSFSAANAECDLLRTELAEVQRSNDISNRLWGITNLKERNKFHQGSEYFNRDVREQEYCLDQILNLGNLCQDNNKMPSGSAINDETQLMQQKHTPLAQGCEDDDLHSCIDKQQSGCTRGGPCTSSEVLKSTTLCAGGKQEVPKNDDLNQQLIAAARSTVENYLYDLKRSYLSYYAGGGDQQHRSSFWTNNNSGGGGGGFHLGASRSTAAALGPCNAWNLPWNDEDMEGSMEEEPKSVRYLSNTLLVNYKQQFKQANKESHEFVARMNHEISEEHAGRLVTRSDNFEFDLEKPVNVNGVPLDTFCSAVRYVSSGAYGNIFAGKLNLQDNGIILKCVIFEDFDTRRFKRLQTELEIIKICKHPNIVTFLDCFYETDKHLAIMMMELCIGSIESLCCVFYGIRDWTLFTQIFLYTAAEILIFLDSLGIMHRDLKPGNFLFSPDLSIKLCDFGTCRIAQYSKTYVGTPCYMAPEVALNMEEDVKEYSSKIDIWSAGVTAMAILMQKSLWGDGDSKKKKICDRLKTEDPPLLKKVKDFTPKTSHGTDTVGKKRLMELKVAIGRMVVRNPENRWSAKQFKQFVSSWCISEQVMHNYFTSLINELGQATCESYDPKVNMQLFVLRRNLGLIYPKDKRFTEYAGRVQRECTTSQYFRVQYAHANNNRVGKRGFDGWNFDLKPEDFNGGFVDELVVKNSGTTIDQLENIDLKLEEKDALDDKLCQKVAEEQNERKEKNLHKAHLEYENHLRNIRHKCGTKKQHVMENVQKISVEDLQTISPTLSAEDVKNIGMLLVDKFKIKQQFLIDNMYQKCLHEVAIVYEQAMKKLRRQEVDKRYRSIVGALAHKRVVYESMWYQQYLSLLQDIKDTQKSLSTSEIRKFLKFRGPNRYREDEEFAEEKRLLKKIQQVEWQWLKDKRIPTLDNHDFLTNRLKLTKSMINVSLALKSLDMHKVSEKHNEMMKKKKIELGEIKTEFLATLDKQHSEYTNSIIDIRKEFKQTQADLVDKLNQNLESLDAKSQITLNSTYSKILEICKDDVDLFASIKIKFFN